MGDPATILQRVGADDVRFVGYARQKPVGIIVCAQAKFRDAELQDELRAKIDPSILGFVRHRRKNRFAPLLLAKPHVCGPGQCLCGNVLVGGERCESDVTKRIERAITAVEPHVDSCAQKRHFHSLSLVSCIDVIAESKARLELTVVVGLSSLG